jgi:ankyrin repeat protein
VIALRRQEDAIAVALLEAGASADFEWSDGYTPLMLAVTGARPETVAALIRHGADVDAVFSDPAIIRILVEHQGYDSGAIEAGMTALSFAKRRAHRDEAGKEIVKLLEAHSELSDPDG